MHPKSPLLCCKVSHHHWVFSKPGLISNFFGQNKLVCAIQIPHLASTTYEESYWLCPLEFNLWVVFWIAGFSVGEGFELVASFSPASTPFSAISLSGRWRYHSLSGWIFGSNNMWFSSRMKILVIMNISVLRFYRYIGDILTDIFFKKLISLKFIKTHVNIRKISLKCN